MMTNGPLEVDSKAGCGYAECNPPYKRGIESFFFQAEDGIRDFCLSRGLGHWFRGVFQNFKHY